MTRDPAVALILSQIAATHRRMDSRIRRAEFLSRRLRVVARPVLPPPGLAPIAGAQPAGDRQLRSLRIQTSPLVEA